MLNNQQHEAAMQAVREHATAVALEGKAVFALVTPAAEVFTPAVTKDGKIKQTPDKIQTTGQLERELPHLTREQSLTILTQHDQASFTLAAASASIIADHLLGTTAVNAAATDTKAWKVIKQACELETGCTAFPASWDNYWTAAKNALKLGMPVTKLLYRNEQDADCVRTRYWLRQEANKLDTTPAKTKAERVTESLDKLILSASGGEDGEGEIVSPDQVVLTEKSQARFLVDIALENFGTQTVRDMLPAIETSIEQDVARLIKSACDQGYSQDQLISMILGYQA